MAPYPASSSGKRLVKDVSSSNISCVPTAPRTRGMDMVRAVGAPATSPPLPWRPHPEHLIPSPARVLGADCCSKAELQKPEFRKPTPLPFTLGDWKDERALPPHTQTLEKQPKAQFYLPVLFHLPQLFSY